MIIDNGVGTAQLFAELNDAVEALAGDRIVCLNAHVAPEKVPPGAIVYNQENVPLQVSPLMFPDHEVWDFSARNVEEWRPRTVVHVPVGYHQTMERFTMRPWEERDIDVIFTGLMNERRAKVLEALVERGLKVVHVPPGIYGARRDALLARSKVALAMLYYPNSVYGTLRAAHLAANKVPFISEVAPDTPEWVHPTVPYDRLVDETVRWLRTLDRGALDHMASFVYGEFRLHPMTLPEPKADRWLPFRGTKLTKDDIAKAYDDLRGEPVSETPRVQVAVPFYRESWRVGQTVMASLERVMMDLETNGIGADLTHIVGDSLICRMRQRVCHNFLLSNATHLLFCDGDIEVLDPACVRRMLQSGHDVVAGAAPFKATHGRVVCNVWPGSIERLEDGVQQGLEHGCMEVRDVGTGFMLISRRALLQLMAAHPEQMHWSRSFEDAGAPLWAIFDTGVVDGIYQSEDYMFCRRWQAIGGKVYVYIPATFRHWGDHGYEGSFCAQHHLTLNATIAHSPDSS
jgi:hypothetical protein